MKAISSFLMVSLVFLMVQCTDDGKKPSSLPGKPVNFSDTYKPEAFTGPDRIRIVKEVIPDIDRVYKEFARDNHMPGLVYGVVVDDSLVCSGETGVLDLDTEQPATTASLFRIASMSKSFTAMAILRLRDEGMLSLSDPVAMYIPEMDDLVYPTEDSPLIAIRHLLRMQAGFPEDNPWGDRQLDARDEELIEMIGEGLSFSSIPSTGYEYSNLGFAMLGNIITRVSGMPYQDYITENILKPLGMNNTVWEYSEVPEDMLAKGYRWEHEQWKPEPMLHDGAFGAMGGIITSIEDFSKYVSFLLSAWPPRNGPDNGPVKRSSLREMQTPLDPDLYPDARDQYDQPCPVLYGYGYGLAVARWCNGETWVMHGGALPGFGSNYMFMPEYGLGFMSFCNLTYTSPGPANFEVKRIIFDGSGISPRELPVSDILSVRKEQVVQLIETWDTALEQEILAENFYMDKSREDRMEEVNRVMEEAGRIFMVDEIEPENQLRGTFSIRAANGVIMVQFTLTPQADPKVQALEIGFFPKEN